MSTTTFAQELVRLRQRLSRERPSPEQDAAVLQQLQRQLRLRPQAELALAGGPSAATINWQRPLAGAGALLTLLALLFAFSLLRLDPAPVPTLQASSGYLPLVSQEEWQRVRGTDEPVWIVPTEMPRERLALFGLPYDAGRAGDNVRADLMVHRDGQVLAVRFVE